MCEECESLHNRSGRPDKVMGQSIVLSEIKTEVPLENDGIEIRIWSVSEDNSQSWVRISWIK